MSRFAFFAFLLLHVFVGGPLFGMMFKGCVGCGDPVSLVFLNVVDSLFGWLSRETRGTYHLRVPMSSLRSPPSRASV